jgi:uroporphyrinogen-III synthase
VRLLVTRPEADAERSAATLRSRGHTVAVAPLLHIEPLHDTAIERSPWAAILITSANAAPAIAAHQGHSALVALPVLAVGERSAQAMRAAGFADVTSADGAVRDLARLVAERTPPGSSLLYLAGADQAGDLAGDLRHRGMRVHTAVVYRAVVAATFPQAAVDALAGGLEGVLHFSSRSAEAYVNTARTAGVIEGALSPVHFCLSGHIAEPLTRAGAANVRVAARPTEAALFDLVGASS